MDIPREPRSLFGDILDWMLVPLLLLWPVSVVAIWLVAQGIANRPFDRELGELARTLARRVTVAPVHSAPQGVPVQVSLSEASAAILRSDPSDAVFFQVLGVRGEWVAGDRQLPVPEEAPAAPGELRFREDEVQGQAVRVAYLWLPLSGVGAATPARAMGAAAAGAMPPLVQVAETLEKRSQLTTEIARGVLLSQFAILPLAVLLVWFALLRGFRPLNALQLRIRQRASDDLSPIDERLAPEEVSPLVGAINDLLARLDRSIAAQKHFLADAAHQLKTPLAGLRTQAELAEREVDAGGDAQAAKRSLHQIARSSQRAAHLVNQLLSMARAEDREQALRETVFNLAALATETVRDDFVPRALEAGIDLGYEGPEAKSDAAPRLRGQPVLVRELIRNLVDNALQYTPRGGTVTLRLGRQGERAVLQVEDNGPGIAEAERELVFQPFYRAIDNEVEGGSGLGLAIVREIAQRHGGSVVIEAPQPGRQPAGTCVTVTLPLRAAT